MNTEIKKTEDEIIDEALANVPEEVQDFMWSDAFNILLDAMQEVTQITDLQKDAVRIEIYDILIGIKDMAAVAQELLKTMAPELVAKILYIIDTEFIVRAENLTEFYSPDPNELSEESEKGVIDAPSPNEVLKRLGQSFTKPTTLTATKRDLSLNASSLDEPVATKSAPSIDPYREIPEK